MSIVDQLIELFRTAGQGAYFGEAVTETAHALQSAHLAERAGASTNLVAAALLHDVGHLLHGLGEDAAQRGMDARHEEAGARWLARHFPSEVVDAVRLHVPAKRYLCAVDPNYLGGLSAASTLSLRLQGGPMSQKEARHFEREPWFASAVAVRRWDDGAKVPDLDVPGLEHYRSCLEAALVARGDG